MLLDFVVERRLPAAAPRQKIREHQEISFPERELHIHRGARRLAEPLNDPDSA